MLSQPSSERLNTLDEDRCNHLRPVRFTKQIPCVSLQSMFQIRFLCALGTNSLLHPRWAVRDRCVFPSRTILRFVNGNGPGQTIASGECNRKLGT